jgi:aconitate hydratase
VTAHDAKEAQGPDTFAEAVRKARIPKRLEAAGKSYLAYDVSEVPGASELPRALVELLENCIRRAPGDAEAIEAARRIVEAGRAAKAGEEISFMPARVLFQDFTGVPVFVDFAAMRDAMVELGGDPAKVSPKIPCTLIVDHSVIADVASTPSAEDHNRRLEATRNEERFAFLKWAADSFDNVRIVPPGEGICHQLNMERFSEIVTRDSLSDAETPVACFDTLVGTDSHTTTANGLGVMGWGVGGIEAEAAALGQPISMLVPPVVELDLEGKLQDGISGMDLALTVCELLRAEGVVGCLVEVTGAGVETLSATQRACVANMTPEYGATTTLFPVDERAIEYLRLTGRSEEQIGLVEAYLKMQGTFGGRKGAHYARSVTLDLGEVSTSLAGPSRPHRRVEVSGLAERFESAARDHGRDLSETFEIASAGRHFSLHHGAIAIAAITSCTTATDPAMMVAAGLLAKNAVSRGLRPLPWVKKILAPGSHATALLLSRAGLAQPLSELGFSICGFGCMSCIGNSGPIDRSLHELADTLELTSILSGNRNFDGRISPDVSQNYLCEPSLVVAYSLVGTLDINLDIEPVGTSSDGRPVMLADLMPDNAQIQAVLDSYLTPELFSSGATGLFDGFSEWAKIPATSSATFSWDESSTYVRLPPYFKDMRSSRVTHINGARTLALLGDFVTTDHISPAGTIDPTGPAAAYLRSHGVGDADFNTFGSRRGNHEVMMRGTFANVKLENSLAKGHRGGWTYDLLHKELTSIYDAAEDYRQASVPLLVIAGKQYGSGSSRDWAAKGPALLGVRAVIAQSFERIHRSNLVQMGVVPLQFEEGQGAEQLGLDGTETYDVDPIDFGADFASWHTVGVRATRSDDSRVSFSCIVRVDTPTEAAFMAAGGILPYVLKELLE